jgi:hypothetical protein
VDKILIVTDKPEPNYDLLTLLSKVFPDCEIEIVVPESKDNVRYWASQHMWTTITKKMGRA